VKIKFLSFLAGMALLAGCVQTKQAFTPQPPLQSFHGNVPGPSIIMRRVAVLPISCDTPIEASLGELDSAVTAELAKTSLFELVPITREALDSRFGRRQFSSVEVLPGDVLTKLRADYGVDGVLFTDLTHYRPYLPISIGMRSKLIDVQTGEVRWAFDHLFDTSNIATAREAEGYYLTTTTPSRAVEHGLDSTAILQSPSRFTKYVAWEAFRSLLDPAAIPN
jgi:hypothetical protein